MLLALHLATPATDPNLIIRVKIFPHLFNYEPQGLDQDPHNVSLKSSADCKVYEGTPDYPDSTGTLLQTTRDLELNADSLSTALWIDCPQPVQVIRTGAKESYSYQGPIYAHAVSTSSGAGHESTVRVVELIHTITVENYIKGVVPIEMPASWPYEALKAQAIAARTYAFYHLGFAREMGDHPFYDIDDTVFYQAFTGVTNETVQSDLAVSNTEDQVLTYQGEIIQAYFSANSGGYTEDAPHVWPVIAPYCQAKKEVYDDPGVDDPWTVTMLLSKLNQKLIEAGLIPNANPVRTLTVPDALRYPSGRARAVRLALRDGAIFDLDALELRKALQLRSTMFSIEGNSKQVGFDGRGYGHGVGMSQDGARALSLSKKWTASQILHFYYTGVQICDASRRLTDCISGF